MLNPSIKITTQVLNLIAKIDEFKGEWKAIGNLAPERLNALKHVATIESIGSSTRIEGVRLSDQEIELLLAGLDKKTFGSRDEQEVAGYADVMNVVFESYEDISFTENYIRQLHKMLLQYSSKDTRHRGEYKKMPNHVEAFDPDGKSLGVIFETSPPFDTPKDMEELMEWTSKQLKEKELHPLLTISVFTVHFLAIHPFQDGNGRLSRILTTLLLLKEGYLYVPYSSLESVIEKNKDNYYLALRRSQATFKSENPEYESWILFFLNAFNAQKEMLSRKIAREKIFIKLSGLSRQIIDLVKDHRELSISEIESITKANRNTIKKKLQELVKDKHLITQGQGKGTRYVIGTR
ncbi:MAG: Fic family protein [Proteobacteria bacterium]|nr:Fic family protein [Pseudomonadota bacterium]MBU1581334.1 Fic family protein [Pseudomonadota bacterium]MBU2452684.1 Fic family protein [Pseudomonadota bacterium]MBU2630028.1 Fic family protein [Pseudomonadota bacterium]